MTGEFKIKVSAKVNMEELENDMKIDGFDDFQAFEISATGDTVTVENKEENGGNILKEYYLIDYITIEQSDAYFEEK